MRNYQSLYFIIILLLPLGIKAQGKEVRLRLPESKGADTSKYPYWIKMMDDPNVIFVKAQKAFYLYWKNREKPEFEVDDEQEHEKGFESEGKKVVPYSFEYRRFKSWEQRSKNMIGEDGKVISEARQIEIWEQTKNEK